MHTLIDVERSYLRQDVPEFRPGDTVRVQVRVVRKATRSGSRHSRGS